MSVFYGIILRRRIGEKQMADIKFDKNNYRIHGAENKSLIKKSLEDCGAGRSILIDNENEIIAGNGVYEQAKKIGLPVKVVETDGSELVVVKRTDLKTNDQKRKELAVMDNTTSDSSEFDIEKLEADFGTGDLGDFGIEGISDIMEGEGNTDTEAGEGEDIPEGEDGAEGKTKGSTGTGAGSLQEIEDNGVEYGAGENQRIIICYKKSDKERLGRLLGVEIQKVVYNVKDLIKARENAVVEAEGVEE